MTSLQTTVKELPASRPLAAATGAIARFENQRPPWEVSSGDVLSTAIDAHFADLDHPGSPGAIIAVLRANQVIHLKGYGRANVEFDVPWDNNVRYTFFSLTKSMVAVAFLRLADLGRVDLDAPIQRYLPDFPTFEDAITIRHLLTHTSGLWQDEALIHLIGVSVSETPLTLDELYELCRKQPRLPFRPGTHFHYSDTGMRLAARIIEVVMGTSLNDALRTLVFNPAGMADAATQTSEPTRRARQASAYLVGGADGPLAVGGTIAESSGDGAVSGTIEDLIAYARFLTNRDTSVTYLERLAAPVEYRPGVHSAYRTCIYELAHRGLRIQQHSGVHGKRMAYVPELDLWVLVMRNAMIGGRDNYTEDVLTAIDAVAGPRDEPPLPYPPIQPEIAALAASFVGRYCEPISGMPLNLLADHGWLSFDLFGERGYLVSTGPNRLQTYVADGGPFIEIAIDGKTLSLRYADWPEPRVLQRIVRNGHQIGLSPYIGSYVSPAYGSIYHIGSADDNLSFHIGAGARAADRFTLRHLVNHAFAGRPLGDLSGQIAGVGILFTTDADGLVTGAILSTDNVAGFELKKIS